MAAHGCRVMRPFSAVPRLRILPNRLCDITRAERLRRIQARCIRLPSGCLLYPAVRDEGYPYIDLQGDDHDRQQWSARRLVWALVNGPLPERGILLRRCVPRNCVTPSHQVLWVPPEQIDWVSSSIRGEL